MTLDELRIVLEQASDDALLNVAMRLGIELARRQAPVKVILRADPDNPEAPLEAELTRLTELLDQPEAMNLELTTRKDADDIARMVARLEGALHCLEWILQGRHARIYSSPSQWFEVWAAPP